VEIRFDGNQPYSTYSVYGGSLINDYFYDPGQQRYYLRVNCNLGALFDLGWTQLCWQQRLQLSGNLTRWLHGLYSSTTTYPIKVSSLLVLSGSSCERIRRFREQLKKSLNELVKTGAIKAWKIDNEDKVHVWRHEK
jgi:TrfA protein